MRRWCRSKPRLLTVLRPRVGDVEIIPAMEPGATDSIFIRGAGIPAIGVGGYSFAFGDARRHGKDERQALASFHWELEHWYQLIKVISDASGA